MANQGNPLDPKDPSQKKASREIADSRISTALPDSHTDFGAPLNSKHYLK